MGIQPPSSYTPVDRLKLWLNGVQQGASLSARRLNLSNAFTVKEDTANNFYNIDVPIPALPTDVAKVDVPNAWTVAQNLFTGSQVNSDLIATLTAAQTLTNKTLTTPIIASILNTGTLTLPTSTDTLVGRATTDTLTNKTISGNTATNLVNGSGTLNLNSAGTMTLPNDTDTVVDLAGTQTLTNKNVNLTNNSVTDTSTANGDIAVSNGTKFLRFAVGTANQVLTTNPTASGLAWVTGAGGLNSSQVYMLPNQTQQTGLFVWNGLGGANGLNSIGTGRLGGLTTKTAATNAVVNDATNGQYFPMSTSTTTNTSAGLTHPVTLTSRQWKPTLTAKVSVSTTTSNILWVGLSTNLTAPSTNTPLGGTDTGIFVGWRSSDTTIQVVTNAAATETFTAYTPSTGQGTGFFILQIFGDNANTRWQVSCSTQNSNTMQAVQNFTTNIPGATTMMAPFVVTSNNTTTNQTIGIPWVQMTEVY